MSKVRENSIARLQQKFPQWSRQQCEAQADVLIKEVRASQQPTDESELKRRIKRKAGL